MLVESAGEGTGLAWCVDGSGARSEVMTLLVEPVAAGDVLLVHAGAAIARLDARAEELWREVR